MDNRREFLKKSMLLSGAAGVSSILPASIQRAMAIDPRPGSTFLDAEHVVILMQENRSFDHCFGTLKGVRGFNDPRAVTLPDGKPVWLQTNAKDETYSPFRLDIKDTKVTWMGALPHSRASQVDAHNEGKYDKWLIAKKPGNKQFEHIPLTMGYYTREDIPFNFAMADAFTVCDQNFCSAMTSTTPNRSFFWTGQINSKEDGLTKANIRNTDYSYGKLKWKTFPELLSENDVKWKFYQNDLSTGGGYTGDERSWLANFGCNLLEFFAAYNVQFSERYVKSLQKQIETLPDEINKLQEVTPSTEAAATKNKADVIKKQAVLDNAVSEMSKWNKESFEKLTDKQKELYYSAFVINSEDPGYRSITTLKYDDNGTSREMTVPAGDVLYQLRKDVKENKLPTVSWIAGPQKFSDHPSAPWYGALYVSEIMDILTSNPEVWKKTIFIVTYDENDGYFDHFVPFSIPDENKPGTGKVSPGIDTEVEHVRLANELAQGIEKKQAREAPIGLGFRVPLLIASPWSRGGKVNSQVFDHTSTLQFLEEFVNKKFSKKIHLDNISQWRRTICGNLTSAFTPFDGTKNDLPFLNKEKFVETIHNAQFKPEPTGYKQFSSREIAALKTPNPLAKQEPGLRASCALPYELYADGKWNAATKSFDLTMAAGNQLFGATSAGSPFRVYAPVSFAGQSFRNWDFAVKAGENLGYSWPVAQFADSKYHLRLHGPNGFYREFTGNDHDPSMEVSCEYVRDKSGSLVIKIRNTSSSDALKITVKDNSYKQADVQHIIGKGSSKDIFLELGKNHNWYDFSIKVNGFAAFEKRYAGRVENGVEGFSDPLLS
ncbi:phospholipase C, phosphocholine-specific [Chitinophaga sp. SYP-B3965]|uniref:phosphocholine-specific phospholipase C n=1 Tax=Chitinophaga sp. SYP-B3965 TaxID=2663120 RepID=UPI001299953D|nr:phospholipase C, phosphocholine-specific [Chitinophaga sp. SYP-B3965]MRG48260.1 phospholipase C, phosphocholine-specific [Chitinophaga sp. SYP-B3965]